MVRTSLIASRNTEFHRMNDSTERADSGSVLNAALAALMLIVAGLGVMAWDNHRDARSPAATFHRP